MKKILAALTVAALAVAPHAFAQSGSKTLDRIKAAKAINVAYAGDSLPFAYKETNGEPRGYSIDLCNRVIAQIGRAVGVPNLKVNWVAATTPQRLDMVASGKADMECGNTTQTLARLAHVDFSNLIYLDSGGFIGRSAAPIARIADASGKKIAVLKGTTAETKLDNALKKRLVNATLVPVDKPEDAMAMLEKGEVDLFAGDRIKLVGLVTLAKDPKAFTLLDEQFSYEPYALALPRNDSAFRLEVNRALSQVYIGGEIQTIYGSWLGVLGRPPDLVMAMYLLYSIPD
jgi:ABC-type amino acid transport substrate-binding protein